MERIWIQGDCVDQAMQRVASFDCVAIFDTRGQFYSTAWASISLLVGAVLLEISSTAIGVIAHFIVLIGSIGGRTVFLALRRRRAIAHLSA